MAYMLIETRINVKFHLAPLLRNHEGPDKNPLIPRLSAIEEGGIISREQERQEKVNEWTAKTAFRELHTDTHGLDQEKVPEIREKYGSNQIEDKKKNVLLKILSFFWGPIPWMIEIAAFLSGIIGHWEDFGLIIALLILNAGVGFWQEHKADNAIEALKHKLALNAKVKRNGKWKIIPSKDLVPGDIVLVRLGDQVPADIILFKGNYLSLDESALTGESLPVDKGVNDTIYSGSTVTKGEMEGVVTKTGMNTFFGETAKLVENAGSQSHFQKAILKIGNYLIVLALILVAVVFIISLFRGENIIDTLQFALVLTVAGIPVALPAVLSVTLAIGAMALSKKDAIVSKLESIEEMAGMDILCSDKTGTITQNKLMVTDIKGFNDHSIADVTLVSYMASKEENSDPIDNAIIEHARKKLQKKGWLEGFIISDFIPFDPVSKKVTAEVKMSNGRTIHVAKGAPQSILELTHSDQSVEKEVNGLIDRYASHGYRSLGVARKDPGSNWEYIGMLALNDPPRKDSASMIKKAKSLGIKVMMITGDHLAIAKEIAGKVGIGRNIIDSSSLDDETIKHVKIPMEKRDGFAQVFPEHKYHIVEDLQSKDHIVGMTGDGVNDAPALKKADVGIAVSGSTDAAKSAASIVLTRPGLSVIINAIEESRKIFQRMNNYATYRITETIRVLLFITLSIIVFNFYPITALMIVLLALLNDAPIMTIAYDNVKTTNEPERWNIREILGISTFLGILGVLVSFGVLFIGRDVFNLSPEVLQSFIYLKLSVAGHLTVFITRTRGHFWTVKPSKLLVIAVVITQIIATIITVYGILLPAMGWPLALFIWGEAIIVFLVTDHLKVIMYNILDKGRIRFSRHENKEVL